MSESDFKKFDTKTQTFESPQVPRLLVDFQKLIDKTLDKVLTDKMELFQDIMAEHKIHNGSMVMTVASCCMRFACSCLFAFSKANREIKTPCITLLEHFISEAQKLIVEIKKLP